MAGAEGIELAPSYLIVLAGKALFLLDFAVEPGSVPARASPGSHQADPPMLGDADCGRSAIACSVGSHRKAQAQTRRHKVFCPAVLENFSSGPACGPESK